MAEASKQVMEFPLWEGEDVNFSAKRKSPIGKYIPFAPKTEAKIIFTSGKTIVEVPGVINGSVASFTVRADDVANVRNGATWRVQFTIDGKNESPVTGKVVRKYV